MIGNHCQHVASTAIAKTGHPGIRPTGNYALSTGDFFTQLTTTQMLPSAIARIGAREILVDQNLGHRGQYMVMR
jgi:DNA mismatch repair ATPase MutS